MSKHHQPQRQNAPTQQARDEAHSKETKTELADIMGDETPALTRPYVGQMVHYIGRNEAPNAAVVREIKENGALNLSVFSREGSVDARWNIEHRTTKLQENVWDYIPNHNH